MTSTTLENAPFHIPKDVRDINSLRKAVVDLAIHNTSHGETCDNTYSATKVSVTVFPPKKYKHIPRINNPHLTVKETLEHL